jgi:hypothetical protein
MKRSIATTSTTIFLSLAALTVANAAAFNTVPLNAQGKPVSSTPVIYGLPNTTLNSSVHPYVLPSTKPVTLNTVPLNTQGKPVSSTPVVYGLTNTTINSSLNVPKTVVTTAAGLLPNTGNFATPNVKATVPKGAPTVPGQSSNYYNPATSSGTFADGTPADSYIESAYKWAVGTIGGAGVYGLYKVAGALGASGATTAATTGVATGTTGAVGANAVVDTVTIGGAEAAGGTSIVPILEMIGGAAIF